MGYDNTNRGILSKNNSKKTEKHPDYRGSINVQGDEYWMSGWITERKDGSGKFLSISIQPKETSSQVSSQASLSSDEETPF